MIQGGDPLGTGTGGPGYTFEDETKPGPSFDKPGLLAMANAGPNTNGSQFFITEVPTPWLTGNHTIFGEVVEGFEIVQQIAHTPSSNDRPKEPVVLNSVEISDS
jgi:peptidyl-prolyl cis-trans isomerase A (cyclophilin A)